MIGQEIAPHDDDSSTGDIEVAPSARGPAKRRRTSNAKTICVAVVADPSLEIDPKCPAHVRSKLAHSRNASSVAMVVGVVLIGWSLSVSTSASVGGGLDIVHGLAGAGTRCTHYIDYEILEQSWLTEHLPFDKPLPAFCHTLLSQSVVETLRVQPQLAMLAASEGLKWLHSLPFHAQRTRRIMGAPGGVPTITQVRERLESLGSTVIPLCVASSVSAKVFMDPCQIVKFLISTRRLRDLSKAGTALDEHLEASFPAEVVESLKAEAIKPPSKDFLRRARPRFDITMMLMRRHLLRQWMSLNVPVWFYVLADASRSCGFEAFNIVESTLKQGELTWRLCPLTYLGVGFTTLADKVFNFLWVAFLEVGPDAALMRWRLSRIAGFCTDRGTEAGMCDVRDILPEFFQAIGCAVFVERLDFLFPNAIWIPGWHHLWDNLIMTVLSKLSFFPLWLSKLRKLVNFLRIDTYRETLRMRATSHDLDPRVLIKKAPRFADWRWDTLRDAMIYVINAMCTLPILVRG
jgi:hypothetical protein